MRFCQVCYARKMSQRFLTCRLDDSGSPKREGGVKKIDVSGLPRDQILNKLTKAINSGDGVTKVASTQSTAEGGVYGWLLELGRAGDFQEATKVFKKAADIVEKLTLLQH